MDEREENELLKKQIEEIAEANGIELTEVMKDNILGQSYFVRYGGHPNSPRCKGVKIDDIKLGGRNRRGGSQDIRAYYSTDEASYKEHIKFKLESDIVNYWFQYDESEILEESEDPAVQQALSDYDEIISLIDGVDDVTYSYKHEAVLNEHGCYAASGKFENFEDVENKFVNNIIQKKGIYKGIEFLLLKGDIEYMIEDELGEGDKAIARSTIQTICDSSENYNDKVNAIDKFIEGLNNSGLELEYIRRIQGLNLQETLKAMESESLLNGKGSISLDDISESLNHHKENEYEEIVPE